MTSIDRITFEGCSGLASVTIGNGVASIGEWAFADCTDLTSITIGKSMTSIGMKAFYGCSNLKKVIVSDIAKWCGIKFGDHTANPLIYAGRLYSDENTEIKDLVIPNSVTSIGEGAFFGCSGLTSITIGNSVTNIGEAAFWGCTGLSSVTIPNSVKSIGGQAFSYSRGLTSVTIGNSVTSIEQYAFYECSGLQKVIISDIATWCGIKFGDHTANPLYYAGHLYSDENTEIKDLVIPNSVTSIGNNAFRSCSGMTSITIPNSVTSIGRSAFVSCSGLTSVTIGNNVMIIGDYAFNFCSGLTFITIPNSVTSIGSHAFDGANVSTIISQIENPFPINGKTSDDETFSSNTFNNATLYVPSGTIDKYKATNGWKDFVHIEEDLTGINVVENTKNNTITIYDLNGVRQSELKKGIIIVNGKKVVVK